MEPREVERRLAAIMSADMVGYSRLMEADEMGTLTRLRTHRLELIDPAIGKHRGRIIKTTGDGMLVEFQSVADAVKCAVEVQREMVPRNADLPAARWIQFRIGINLGDVIVEDGDVFGDGVNVAARLQELADPGGICVSRAVRDQVQVGDLFDLLFEDLGEQNVKNIVRPIATFRVRLHDEADAAPAKTGEATPAVASPSERPSIAVLPFANMSGDPEQEFFADGLTEDIITALSRFRDLFVISRNSAFVYKGQAVRIQDFAAEVGVQYVVEGSVRKAGNRVRVTVQLIDATSDRHIWAERYDRDLEDIFAIQDEVTSAIVATLPGRIEAAHYDRAEPTANMAAYECVLTGKVLHHRSTRTDNEEAQRMLDRAIALDPKYAHAHAWKACVLGQAWVHGWGEDRDAMMDRIGEELRTARALDDNDSDVHRIFAAWNLIQRDHDRAMFHQERALSLNPNNDLIVVQQGEVLTWLGRPEEGIDWIKRAMRLNPYHPERYWNHLGRAYYVAHRYAEAAEAFGRISAPDPSHHAFLAASFAQMGDAAAAAAHAEQVIKRAPDFSVQAYLDTLHYKHASDREHHRDGLLKAGLPA